MTAVLTHDRIRTRTRARTVTNVDDDVAFLLARRMERIIRRLSPQTRVALAESAMLLRAKDALCMARSAEDVRDRCLEVVWKHGSPTTVHWAVPGLSPGSHEARLFLACGGETLGNDLRDSPWRRGTETNRTISCPRCLALLEAARG